MNPNEQTEEGMFIVPVPLEDGRYAKLLFPPEISVAEAQKIARVVMAYACLAEGIHQ